jgi:hypothetical protein
MDGHEKTALCIDTSPDNTKVASGGNFKYIFDFLHNIIYLKT